MDEEESFARLLSSSTRAPQPTSLYSTGPGPTADADPWANPFSDHSIPSFPTSTSTVFASPPSTQSQTLPSPPANALAPGPSLLSAAPSTSPYVQRLEADDAAGIGSLPDPPSVIAAREAMSMSDVQVQDVFQSRQYDTLDAPSPFANDYYGTPSTTQPAAAAEAEGFGGSTMSIFQSSVAHDPEVNPFGGQEYQSTVPEFVTLVDHQAHAPEVTRRALDSLIDDDLLSERDPSVSLKKAFVKTEQASNQRNPTPSTLTPTAERKAYVFVPAGKSGKTSVGARAATASPATLTATAREGKEEAKVTGKEEPASSETEMKPDQHIPQSVLQNGDHPKDEMSSEATTTTATTATTPIDMPTTTVPPPSVGEDAVEKPPASIPLPPSSEVTPTPSRPRSPGNALPDIIASKPVNLDADTDAESSPAPVPTPVNDRVSVSPLDPPSSGQIGGDYGFRSLSIGGVANNAEPSSGTQAATAVDRTPLGWGGDANGSASGSKFGRGWGEVEDDVGASSASLFGTGGGMGVGGGKLDPWGADEDSGWSDKSMFTPAITTSSRLDAEAAEAMAGAGEEKIDSAEAGGAVGVTHEVSSPSTATGTPRTSGSRSKLLSTPIFQITVSDPTKVGDPVRGHVVYTVRTKTTSPHYRKGEMSALRRFSDFLWLFESLTLNNPGVIVPPVPDKHAFGRFQETFIETRRAALERCLAKITSHPILQLDPDLRLFLESDSFATDSKHRRLATAPDRDGGGTGGAGGSGGGNAATSAAAGLLASWTGPKFVESDDWFDSRKAYLDNLEASLKSLSKSLEAASKSRLDMAVAYSDFASAAQSLAESDLGTAMCAALNRLASLAGKEKEALEDQAKADVVHLLNLADEYVRFIASVRLAFASRVKIYLNWQAAEKEAVKVKQAREKARVSGKLGDRVNSSLAEIAEADRRARDLSIEFENISKLVKAEFARFERERVDEFRRTLERHLEGQIARQKDLIEAWESYHASVLNMVQRAQGKA